MEPLNLPIFVIIIISVTSKFSQMSSTSLKRTSMPHEIKKQVGFDVGNILTKVEGLSVKIDGLVDLGPKWNFEYTFVPYSDKNIARTGPEVENDGGNDETTPTTVGERNTENLTTKKKHHKMRAVTPEHSSESSRNSSESSNSPSSETSAHAPEKMRSVNSSEALHKSSKKKAKSSQKINKSSEKGDKSSEKSSKPAEKTDKSSEKGGKSSEKSLKSSVRIGKLEKSSENSGTATGKSKKSHEKSGKSRKTHVKRHKSKTNAKHEYIYKDVDNNSLILPTPHKVQDDARLRDFTVHVYKQALRIFDDLKKKFNDTKSNKKIDDLIRNYRDKFAEFVNETQYVSVKTRLGTQKVILNTMESSNMILKKLIDHLMADSVQKTVLRNERRDVAGLLEQQLEKEIDVEYRHVCSKFGICRTGYVFSNFLADVIGELIRADDKKLRMAVDALTETLNEQTLNHVLEKKVEKRFRAEIGMAEKTSVGQLRAVLQIVRGILVNKNKPLPVMGSLDSRVMNRSLAVLDLIDLFDDNIKANEVNKLAWNDLKASCRDWADGSREDTIEIMDALVRHVMKSGLDKFDGKAIQVLNNNLKVYYDLKR